MKSSNPGDITRLLSSLALGDSAASGQIFEKVYDQLRRLAAVSIRPSSQFTLQPTALVHEAWLKLDGKLEGVRDRGHFLALAGLAMRQILSNRARDARALRHDARRVDVTVDLAQGEGSFSVIDLVALDDALTKLNTLNERHARVVELRFLAALSIAETARVLGVSTTTVESDWAMAQAWLRTELNRD